MLSREVVWKQTAMGLYREHYYTSSVLMAQLPLAILSDFIFATVLYWLCGWVPDVPRWLFFYLIIFALDLAVSVIYRTFSFAVRSQEIAMTSECTSTSSSGSKHHAPGLIKLHEFHCVFPALSSSCNWFHCRGLGNRRFLCDAGPAANLAYLVALLIAFLLGVRRHVALNERARNPHEAL